MVFVKINIQCNKPEITSVRQKKLLLMVNKAKDLGYAGEELEVCVHSFRAVVELCVMDEEGVFVCLCAFLLAVFAFDFHWSLVL